MRLPSSLGCPAACLPVLVYRCSPAIFECTIYSRQHGSRSSEKLQPSATACRQPPSASPPAAKRCQLSRRSHDCLMHLTPPSAAKGTHMKEGLPSSQSAAALFGSLGGTRHDHSQSTSLQGEQVLQGLGIFLRSRRLVQATSLFARPGVSLGIR